VKRTFLYYHCSKLTDKGIAVAVIINRGELYPRRWLLHFNARLVEWPGAKEALETLERKGFQREVLLRELYKYVTSSQTLEPRRVAARRACREIQSCLEQLERASAALSSLRSNSDVWASIYAAIPKQQVLELSLAKFQESLTEIKRECAKKGSAKSAGRDEESLVTLAMTVEGRTGAKHRRELALLLQVAAEADGKRFPGDEGTIRKIFERFRESYPVMCQGIQDFYAPESRKRGRGRVLTIDGISLKSSS